VSVQAGGTPVEIRHGRRAIVSTDMPDWIILSGASPVAVHIYAILNAHVNQRRGDGKSWPTQDTIAAMVGYSRGDKIKPFITELVTLGAIEVDYSNRMPRRCCYTVHEVPADGYAGPMTVAAWYQQRDAEKGQVTPVTPARGEQAPVTPARGEHVPPVGGEHVAPVEGDKQSRRNNLEETTTPPTPSDETAGPDPAGPGGGEKDQQGKGNSPASPTPQQIVEAVCRTGDVIPARQPRGRTLDLIAEKVAGKLAEGWSAGDLVDALGGSMLDVINVRKVIEFRLAELGPPPPPAPPRPPVKPPAPAGQPKDDGESARLLEAGRMAASAAAGAARAAVEAAATEYRRGLERPLAEIRRERRGVRR
jgi:hypothetical protein